MRFDELPRDWAQRPITDPDVFEGVVDLIVTEQSRSDGATYLLLCHPNRRLLQPICLPDEPRRVDVGQVLEGVALLLTEVCAPRRARRRHGDRAARAGRPPRRATATCARRSRAPAAPPGFTLHAVAIAAPDAVAVLPPAGELRGGVSGPCGGTSRRGEDAVAFPASCGVGRGSVKWRDRGDDARLGGPMAQQAHSSGKTVTRSYRTGVGGAWWTALVVVTVLLGFLGRSDGGFWSGFLWSIVGFVVGSLVADRGGRAARAGRSEDEAFAGLGGSRRLGGHAMKWLLVVRRVRPRCRDHVVPHRQAREPDGARRV